MRNEFIFEAPDVCIKSVNANKFAKILADQLSQVLTECTMPWVCEFHAHRIEGDQCLSVKWLDAAGSAFEYAFNAGNGLGFTQYTVDKDGIFQIACGGGMVTSDICDAFSFVALVNEKIRIKSTGESQVVVRMKQIECIGGVMPISY